MFVLLLCMALSVIPAMPINAAQPVAQVGESPLAGSDGALDDAGLPDGAGDGQPAPGTVTYSVDLTPLLAGQQQAISLQGEALAVLKSCNTLLLSLALFELFRLGRGMSKRVFGKGVTHG